MVVKLQHSTQPDTLLCFSFARSWPFMCESQPTTASSGTGCMGEPQGMLRRHITEKVHTECSKVKAGAPCHLCIQISLNEMETPRGRNHLTFKVEIVLSLWVSTKGWSFVQDNRQMEKACHQLCDEPFLTSSALTALQASVSFWVMQAESQSCQSIYEFLTSETLENP